MNTCERIYLECKALKVFWNYITDIWYNSLNEMSRIIVLIQTLQITVAEEVKLMKGAEPYVVIYRETRCDNASQSKKKWQPTS